jgi:hypothetical protein
LEPGGFKLRVNWIRLVQPHLGGRLPLRRCRRRRRVGRRRSLPLLRRRRARLGGEQPGAEASRLLSDVDGNGDQKTPKLGNLQLLHVPVLVRHRGVETEKKERGRGREYLVFGVQYRFRFKGCRVKVTAKTKHNTGRRARNLNNKCIQRSRARTTAKSHSPFLVEVHVRFVRGDGTLERLPVKQLHHVVAVQVACESNF